MVEPLLEMLDVERRGGREVDATGAVGQVRVGVGEPPAEVNDPALASQRARVRDDGPEVSDVEVVVTTARRLRGAS